MNLNNEFNDTYFFYLFCLNSFPISELSVKFASQVCHENNNNPLDGAYLADFGIDITAAVTAALICKSLIVTWIWLVHFSLQDH